MPSKHLWPRAASFIGEFKHWRSLFGLVFFKSFILKGPFFWRYHPDVGPPRYSCASRRISSSAQPAYSVRSLIDVCNLLLILLYARIWSYVSRYYFFPVVCPGCVILFPLKLYWIWGVIAILLSILHLSSSLAAVAE
jgi:hypothetical protein